MIKKYCSKCHIEYPATKEYFQLDKRNKSGLGARCRKCAYAASAICMANNKKYSYNYYRTFRGYITCLTNRIKQRCTNSNHPRYKYYGGRGIKCKFTADELYDWLVANDIDPRGLQVHRINNDGDYILDNIVFVTDGKHRQLHKIIRKIQNGE